MATRKSNKTNTTEVQEPTVYCSYCRNFLRDTEGTSQCLDTGEYFMGICTKGMHPDSPIKQFANKPRHCKSYIA